jgi:hypothetical protein
MSAGPAEEVGRVVYTRPMIKNFRFFLAKRADFSLDFTDFL